MTCSEIHARERMEKLFLRWQGLQKVALRKTDTQIRKEEKFTADLDKLFDVAHAKAMNLITIEENRAFLLARRDGQIGFLRQVDKELAAKKARSAKCKQEAQIRAEEAKVSGSAAQACYEEYVSTSSSESGNTELCEQYSSSTMQSPMKWRCTITRGKICPALAQALDRA